MYKEASRSGPPSTETGRITWAMIRNSRQDEHWIYIQNKFDKTVVLQALLKLTTSIHCDEEQRVNTHCFMSCFTNETRITQATGFH